MTVCVSSVANGYLLPFQIIFTDKTDQCLPKSASQWFSFLNDRESLVKFEDMPTIHTEDSYSILSACGTIDGFACKPKIHLAH